MQTNSHIVLFLCAAAHSLLHVAKQMNSLIVIFIMHWLCFIHLCFLYKVLYPGFFFPSCSCFIFKAKKKKKHTGKQEHPAENTTKHQHPPENTTSTNILQKTLIFSTYSIKHLHTVLQTKQNTNVQHQIKTSTYGLYQTPRNTDISHQTLANTTYFMLQKNSLLCGMLTNTCIHQTPLASNKLQQTPKSSNGCTKSILQHSPVIN